MGGVDSGEPSARIRVRLLAASEPSIEVELRQGGFRADLHRRLPRTRDQISRSRSPRRSTVARTHAALVTATHRAARRAVCIEPLSGRETLVAIIAHLYRLDVGRRDALRQDFDRLAHLARRVSARRLYVPRGFARLTDVREAILSDLGL